MDEIDYNDVEIEKFGIILSEAKYADEYGYWEFDVAPGVSVELDWSMEYDEPTLPITVVVHGVGLDLFSRAVGDTLTKTGELGHGPNHGDELAADLEHSFYHHFTKDFDELTFEFVENQNGDAWVFQAWVTNPNYEWEE